MTIVDYLHLLHSDGADGLQFKVGRPPVIILDGEEKLVEGPAITVEDAEQMFQSISTTRQRREFHEQGQARFIYRFRNRVDFVVWVRRIGGNIEMDIR